MVLVIIRNPDMPLQTGRVLRGGRHALIELIVAQREAGDPVARLQNCCPLGTPDRTTFYDGGAEGELKSNLVYGGVEAEG
jgi:hypothetical protein